MSGGHFNYNGYIYFQVEEFANQLEKDIANNNIPDEYGYSSAYNNEVIDYLKFQVSKIRQMAETMRAIDYLYSGDHGEDSFLKVIQDLEKKSKSKKSKKRF